MNAEQLSRFARVLGRELRAARKQRGWTRRDLRAHLRTEQLSLQTLATYEMGTRGFSVVRLVELCQALGVRADDVLGRAIAGAFGSEVYVTVDLMALADTVDPRLGPVQRWAAERANACPGHKYRLIEDLDGHALDQLANLAGVSRNQLLEALRDVPGSQ